MEISETSKPESSNLTSTAALASPSGRNDFKQGFISSLALWPGTASFGLAYALAALAAGLNPLAIQAMSLLVYAGGAQLTAAGLFATGVSGLSIVLTTLVINLRNLLFMVAVTPYLRTLNLFQRCLLAFGLSEESYALSIERMSTGQSTPFRLVGVNAGLYICWQASTLAGLWLGGRLTDPAVLNLSLVFPLSFSVLLMPYIKSRPALAAALVGGVLALSSKLLLGGSWYLLIGGLGGSLVGMLLEQRKGKITWKYG